MHRSLRITFDALLVLLLPVMVCYALTGRLVHEWLGLGMLVVLVAHHVINRYWFGALAKGRYTRGRSLGTAINFLLLADVLVLMVTGIFLSRYALGWMGLKPYRPPHCHAIHIAAAYWGLILMGLHIGLHTPWITGVLRLNRAPKAVRLLCHLLCLAAAGYGVYAVCTQNIGECLLAQAHFVDFPGEPIVMLAETTGMMMLFAVIGNILRK